MAVEFFKKGLGYRQIENVLAIVFKTFGQQKSPSDSTIRQWLMRLGHYKIHRTLPKSKWMLLSDVTVDIGKIKCLVTCGVNLKEFNKREEDNYILKQSDLEIVGIYPTTQSNGEFAHASFQDSIEKLGGVDAIKGLLIDQGPDLKKGGRLLQEANNKLKIYYELSHKFSLILEKDFTADPKWSEYTAMLTKTKQLVQQTELAALQPPKQRSKARFMNTHLYIKWPERILESKAAGYLNEIPENRYKEYFGWLEGYLLSLSTWRRKVGVIEFIKSTIREYGLSEDSYNYLLTTVAETDSDKESEEFIGEVFSSLYEEVEKLDEGQILPAFTESLESGFGSFKYHTARGGQGITGNVLILGTIFGTPLSAEQICEALEKTPVVRMLTWVTEKIGDSLSKIRNRFFNGPKKQDLTGKPAAAATG